MATSSLNPLAQEWKPQSPSSPHITFYFPQIIIGRKIHHINPQPPQPVVGFPAAEGLTRHHFYHVPYDHFSLQQQQSHPDGGPAAIKKVAPPPPHTRRSNLKKLALPPRLRPKSKIWRPKAKAEGSSPVPAAADRGDSFSPAASGKTTVMIRNIPNQYQRDSFMAFLDKYCLESCLQYDFLYLPMDFKTNNNVGYAFVNFTTAAAAAKIRERLQNYEWGFLRTPAGYFTSRKICEVGWARIQGRKELVKHFQKSNFVCSTPDFLPAVFSPPRNGSPESSAPHPIGNLMGNVPYPCKG